MERTIVKLVCVSKKQSGYGTKDKLNHSIEFAVPYENNGIFYQMSGGTTLTLNTVNQEAAAIFEVGEFYEMALQKADAVTGN